MKKRILSLILALSMVLSVLPLGAFAEGSTGDLVIGSDGYPIGTQGNGWKFSDGTLTLTRGTYNFSYTTAVTFEIQLSGQATITGGTFMGKVSNDYGTISYGTFKSDVTNNNNINGGTFEGSVKNWSTISGGTFEGSVANFGGGKISGGTFSTTVTNYSGGTISGGTFQNRCSVTNYADGTISGGTFQNTGSVKNKGKINGDGTFNGEVTNSGTIERGTFTGTVTNKGTIENGTFTGTVTNNTGGTISGGTFSTTVKNGGGTIAGGTFNGTVENFVGTISGGTFAGSVTNKGTITSGTFNGKVKNYRGRTISGGTFKGTVNNEYGTISGGTFAAGLSKNNGSKILGGIFNGNANLTGAYHVTVTDGSLLKVNGEDPLNADETTGTVTPGTAWDLYSYAGTTVTIIASTEIFSLNGQPIAESNYPNKNDKTTVTFTMPNENVVLSGAITCTDLVMKKGYPEDSNGGTTPCKGNGWTYSKKDASNPKGKLTLTDGTYDFSYTYPQNSNGAGAEPVACAVETQLRVEITGGTFEGEVINNDLGVISGGTFHEKV